MARTRKDYLLIVVLFGLYFVQGLPYGLQVYFIPVALRKRGISLAKITMMRLASIPWILKFMWAPLFDFLRRPIFMWVLSCLLLSSVAFLTLSLSPPESTLMVTVGLAALNLFAAVMDIAVDGFAIQALSVEDIGLGNIAQAVGYKVGMLTTGGALLYFYDFISWSQVHLLMSCSYLVLTTIWSCHIYGKPTFLESLNRANGIKQPRLGFYRMLYILIRHVEQCGALFLFLLVYKAGEQGLFAMVPLYLTDNGSPSDNIQFITGFNSIISSIGGSTFAGILLSSQRIGAVCLLKRLCFSRPILMLGSIFFIWHDLTNSLPMAIIHWLLAFASGMITTATFTYMMHYSQTLREDAQTTFYTLLATMEVLGKLITVSLAGLLVQVMGYFSFFCACALACFIPLLISYNLRTLNFDEYQSKNQ